MWVRFMTRHEDGYVPPASNAKQLAYSLNCWQRRNFETPPFIDPRSYPDSPNYYSNTDDCKDVPFSLVRDLANEVNRFPWLWELHERSDFIELAERWWAQMEALAIAPEASEPTKAAAKRL